MKKSLITAFLILIVLSSCEKKSIVSDENLFVKDNGVGYRYSDFEIYDSSTHIFYFKNSHPESPYKLLHIRDYDIITHQGFLSQERRSLIHSLDICLLNRYLLGEWIRDDRLFWFIGRKEETAVCS